jgi:hypothetical protein
MFYLFYDVYEEGHTKRVEEDHMVLPGLEPKALYYKI